MKIIYLLITLIIGSASLQAQITIKGQTLNAESGESIPYVNIGITAKAKGTVSDFEGKYRLVAETGDMVTISAIGYKTIDVKAEDLKRTPLIQLESKGYELSTIEIEAQRFKSGEVMLGLKNKTRGLSIGFGSAQLGTEIGALIEVDHPTYIKNANFVLNHAKGDSLLFRVNIYSYKDGKVGDNLLPENVFIKEKQRKGTITVDLSAYNLILDSDVMLSLEWLRNFDEVGNKNITFDTKKSRKLKGVYAKYFSNGTFRKVPFKAKLKPCFYFIGKELE